MLRKKFISIPTLLFISSLALANECPPSTVFSHLEPGKPWHAAVESDWIFTQQTGAEFSNLTAIPNSTLSAVVIGFEDRNAVTIRCEYPVIDLSSELPMLVLKKRIADFSENSLSSNFKMIDSTTPIYQCQFKAGSPQSCEWHN